MSVCICMYIYNIYIYIYIYICTIYRSSLHIDLHYIIYIHTYRSSRSLFDLSCTDELSLSNGKTAAAHCPQIVCVCVCVYIYIMLCCYIIYIMFMYKYNHMLNSLTDNFSCYLLQL